jgi:hypothetical protein
MKCTVCGAEIKFITTPKGKKMPVEVTRVTVVTITGQIVIGYPPHWANCPGARSRFAKKKE